MLPLQANAAAPRLIQSNVLLQAEFHLSSLISTPHII